MKINNINSNQFSSIEQVTGKYLNKNALKKAASAEGKSFVEILKQKQLDSVESSNELKFSKHANERLSSRNISLTDEQMVRLQDGARQASEKGINESLVLVDDLAFIVNVKNNTVITAMDQRNSVDNVYTNIDGAVVI